MASEAMRLYAEMIREMREMSPLGAGDVSAQREQMEAQQGQLSIPEDVEREELTVAGRPARWVRAPGARRDACVLYLHGGGYMMGSLNTHQELMARISRATGASVLGLGYRLAPEHPYPAAVDDALAAYRWLLELGLASRRVVIAGDSAGGGLTMATLLALKDAGEPQPAGATVFSPWTDLTGSGDSVHTRAEADPMIRPDALEATAAHYLGGQSARLPGVSPLFGDLAGLPPLLIQVGDAEVLLDDATRLHQAAEDAGVESSLHVFDEAFHVFQAVPDLPESAEALEEMAAFFHRVIDTA
ncbi:MAG: alpha/beta hydrolase [Pseudomonadales bacterium]